MGDVKIMYQADALTNVSFIIDEEKKELMNGKISNRSFLGLEKVLADGEIINIDKNLDLLFLDTIPTKEVIELPYETFFLNKRFNKNAINIEGIGVSKKYSHQLSKLYYAIMFPLFEIKDGVAEKHYIEFDINGRTEYDDISNALLERTIVKLNRDLVDMKIYEEKLKNTSDSIDLIKYVLNYVWNFIFSLSNKNIELKIIEKPYKNKINFENNDMVVKKMIDIKVGKNVKRYLKEYEKAKRKCNFKESFIVRGYWRTYRNDRYVNKKGQTQWIPPYIKGETEKLMHRIVNVK